MASTRSFNIPGIWARGANTTIPNPPVSGVVYRNENVDLAEFEEGWPFDTLVDGADFNQIMFLITSVLRAIDKCGILPWSADVDYDLVPAFAVGSDGELYRSKVINGPNTVEGVQDPALDADESHWCIFSGSGGSALGNIAVDTFTRGTNLVTGQTNFALAAPAPSANGVFVIENNTVNVNKTVAGNVVTLQDSPGLPGTAGVAADVDTVTIISFSPLDIGTPADDTVTLQKLANGPANNLLGFDNTGAPDTYAIADFLISAGLSLTANGYVQLTNGLIVQWGSGTSSAILDLTVPFPLAFPNGVFSVNVTADVTGQAANFYFPAMHANINNNSFDVRVSGNGDANALGQRSAADFTYIAIGF